MIKTLKNLYEDKIIKFESYKGSDIFQNFNWESKKEKLNVTIVDNKLKINITVYHTSVENGPIDDVAGILTFTSDINVCVYFESQIDYAFEAYVINMQIKREEERISRMREIEKNEIFEELLNNNKS